MTSTPQTSHGQALGQAFSNPVLGTQLVFRAVLDALANPGIAYDLGEPLQAPATLHPSSARLLLTLADFETPVWLSASLVGAAASWVRFHCGAPIVDDPRDARFAVLDGADAAPLLAAFHLGDERYPETSATVIVQVAALAGGETVLLSGPGLRVPLPFAPAGLRSGFWDEARANAARYPLGVDLIFVAGDAIAGLPRSTRIAVGGGAG